MEEKDVRSHQIFQGYSHNLTEAMEEQEVKYHDFLKSQDALQHFGWVKFFNRIDRLVCSPSLS